MHIIDSDKPRPTENGGYTHTKSSKRKIGDANRGKKPWNKEKTRSEAERAQISAGVRARNKATLKRKLEELGITEEQYMVQKKAKKLEREKLRRRKLNKVETTITHPDKLQGTENIEFPHAESDRCKIENVNQLQADSMISRSVQNNSINYTQSQNKHSFKCRKLFAYH